MPLMLMEAVVPLSRAAESALPDVPISVWGKESRDGEVETVFEVAGVAVPARVITCGLFPAPSLKLSVALSDPVS